jgi:hypothetical protein
MRKPAASETPPRVKSGLDHDDFGLIQSKIMNVIDSKDLERDAGGKPVPTFPHPALGSQMNRAAFQPAPIGPR